MPARGIDRRVKNPQKMEGFSNTTEKLDVSGQFFEYVNQRPINRVQAGPPAATIGVERKCQTECKIEESVMLCCNFLFCQEKSPAMFK